MLLADDCGVAVAAPADGCAHLFDASQGFTITRR